MILFKIKNIRIGFLQLSYILATIRYGRWDTFLGIYKYIEIYEGIRYRDYWFGPFYIFCES